MTIGREARLETACSARATTPLPVPFSPSTRTLASDGPTREITCSTPCIDGGLGDQLRHALAAQQRVLGLEPLPLAQRLAQLDLRADDRQQPGVVPRLLDEVARAAAHRLDGDFDAAPGRHDDDRQRRIDALDARQQVQAFFARRRVARVVQVDQRDVELARLERGEHAGRRRRGLEVEAFGLEQQPQRLEDVRLVVGDEHARSVVRTGWRDRSASRGDGPSDGR